MELKILDINLWMLPPPLSSDNKKRLSKFVEVVSKLDPDLITLQEIWLIKDVKYLGKSLPDYHIFYSGRKRFNNSGLVILTKKKPFSEKLFQFRAYHKEGLIERAARKGYQVIKLRLKGKSISILNTHLYAARKNRANPVTLFQFRTLKRVTARGNWIISGDLNIPQEIFIDLNNSHFKYKAFKTPTISQSNKYTKSRLNRFDRCEKKIDYLLLKSASHKDFSHRAKIITSPLMSDHYAIYSVITLNGRK